MAQVIKHTEEKNDVEFLAEAVDVVDREFLKLDIELERVSRELRLRQVMLVEINADHARGAAPFHLDAVEAGIATDVEHAFVTQVVRQCMLEALPFLPRVIAQEMRRRGFYPADVDVVKPLAKLVDALGNFFARKILAGRNGCAHASASSIFAAGCSRSRLSNLIASR